MSSEETEWLGHYLRRIAHDFSAPLRHVVSFSELLQKHMGNELDEKSHKYLDYIMAGGKEMQTMLNGAQMVGRIQSDTAGAESVPLKDLVGDLWNKRLSSKYPNANLTYEAESGAAILLDPIHAHTTIHALLDNACRYNPNGVEIRFHAAKEGDMEILTVSDNGCGIKETEFDYAKQIFARHHIDIPPKNGGVGLTCVDAVAKRYGGDFTFRKDEAGNHFILKLPAT